MKNRRIITIVFLIYLIQTSWISINETIAYNTAPLFPYQILSQGAKELRILAEIIQNELKEAGIVGVRVKQMGGKIILEGIVRDANEKKKMISIIEAYTGNYTDLVEVGIGEDFLVVLEIFLIEIGKRYISNLGVKWPLILDFPISVQLGLGNTKSTSTSISENIGEDILRTKSIQGTESTNQAFSLSMNSQFIAGLRLLINEGKSRILSNPKIVVKNGETAKFIVGGQLPIPQITTAAGVQTTAIQFRDFGIVLEVKPKVDRSENISLSIHAELSEPSPDLQVQNVPGFITRNISTTVLIRPSHTLLLSGLSSKNESKREEKLPLLGDIPIIGALFKTTNKEFIERDLIIFLTPYVYRLNEVEKLKQEEIDTIKEKYEEMKKEVR